MFQHVGISWLIKSKDQFKLSIEEQCCSWVGNVPWYNTTIFHIWVAKILNISLLLHNNTGMILCVLLTHMKSCIQRVLILWVVEVVDCYYGSRTDLLKFLCNALNLLTYGYKHLRQTIFSVSIITKIKWMRCSIRFFNNFI